MIIFCESFKLLNINHGPGTCIDVRHASVMPGVLSRRCNTERDGILYVIIYLPDCCLFRSFIRFLRLIMIDFIVLKAKLFWSSAANAEPQSSQEIVTPSPQLAVNLQTSKFTLPV